MRPCITFKSFSPYQNPLNQYKYQHYTKSQHQVTQHFSSTSLHEHPNFTIVSSFTISNSSSIQLLSYPNSIPKPFQVVDTLKFIAITPRLTSENYHQAIINFRWNNVSVNVLYIKHILIMVFIITLSINSI